MIRFLQIVWLVITVLIVPPAAVIASAMWEVADRYLEAGYLPFHDAGAERAATQWLSERGKRSVRIQFEIDPSWALCPRRVRCYHYTATDAQGRYEEGQVWTKASDPTAPEKTGARAAQPVGSIASGRQL